MTKDTTTIETILKNFEVTRILKIIRWPGYDVNNKHM